MALGPVENRAEFANVPPENGGSWELADVGFAVYPSYGGNAAPDNTDVPDETAHRERSSLVWSADSKLLAFVDAQNNEPKAILVSFANDLSVASVRGATLASLSYLCHTGPNVKGCSMAPVEGVELTFDTARTLVRVSVSGPDYDKTVRAVDLPIKTFVAVK